MRSCLNPLPQNKPRHKTLKWQEGEHYQTVAYNIAKHMEQWNKELFQTVCSTFVY